MDRIKYGKATELIRQIDLLDSLLKDNLLNHGFIKVKTTNYLPKEVYPEIKPIWDEMNKEIIQNLVVTFSEPIKNKLYTKLSELQSEFEKL